MKVYLVTSGSYSDYHIERIFTTRALAEQYIADRKSDSYHYNEIEEWPVHTAPIGRVVVYLAIIDMVKTNPPTLDWQSNVMDADDAGVSKRPKVKRLPTWVSSQRSVRVTGLDKAAVEKAAHDQMALMRAEAEGLVP